MTTHVPYSSASYISFATFRRSGKEVRTPVWVAESQGCLYVFSEGDAGKVKRVRANGRARWAPCSVRGVVAKGADWVDGTARIVQDADTLERAYAALRRKYGLQMRAADLLSKWSGRYEKRAMLEIRPSTASG